MAEFYAAYLAVLETLDVRVHLDPMPVELKDPIRFHDDTEHYSYDSDAVLRFWQVLSHAHILLKRFSTNFYALFTSFGVLWTWR